MTPAVSIRHLDFSYGSRAALTDVSLEVGRGEIFGLLGPNGGGKSTLFRLISTLLPIGPGKIDVAGHDVAAEPDAVRRLLGVTFQSPSLDRKLTVGENLKCQGHLYGLSGQTLQSRINGLLEQFGVADRRRDLVETLSGGLQRRVEVAKSLLHSPRILLLDEPSTGLDPGARRELWQIIRGVQQAGDVTVIVSTHLMDEADGCDRLAILDRGQVAALGAPHQLRASIGGDCVTVTPRGDIEVLLRQIPDKLGTPAQRLGGQVRVEVTDAGTWVQRLLNELGESVEQVSLGKPTLEDVFVQKTGRRLSEADEPAFEHNRAKKRSH